MGVSRRGGGGWPCAEATNGEVRGAPVQLGPPEDVQPRLYRDEVGDPGDWDDSVKSVLGSSSGRTPSESALEGGRESRTRLKSSALASRVSQLAKAERVQ